MSDFAFLDRPLPSRSRAQHIEDVRREYFRSKVEDISTDAETAIDYCRDLLRSGAKVDDELKQLKGTASALLLVARFLEREARGVE